MVKKKYLTTPVKVRRYLNQLINDFNAEKQPDISKYRALTYMLKAMLDCFQFEKDLEIESRIEAI